MPNNRTLSWKNGTAVNMSEEDHWSTELSALRTIIILLISLAILVSNLINVTVLRRTQQIPSVAKLFLTNLGIADLVVGVITCLPCVVPAATTVWPYGDVWCQVAGILHGTCVTVSIWTVAVLSIERFVAVIFPLKYKNKLNQRKVLCIIACLWGGAFISFIAANFTTTDFIYYQYNEGSCMCGMYWENIWLCIITGVYIPILSGGIILFTTVSITRALKRARPVGNQVAPVGNQASKAGKTKRKQKDEKAVKVLITTTVVFFTFWGPYVTMVFTASFDHSIVLPLWLEFVLTWLANSNSFVNVIIYSAVYDAFRLEAKALVLSTFRCRCFRRRPIHDSKTTTDNTDVTATSSMH